ncbi:hypothetical protein pb186bvf_008702 [Paramecium bursaria]
MNLSYNKQQIYSNQQKIIQADSFKKNIRFIKLNLKD